MRDSIVGLINPLISLILAATFFAIWYRGKERREVLAFAASYALFGCGFLWSQFAPLDNAKIAFNATFPTNFAAAVLLIWGATHRLGARLSFAAVCSIAVIAVGMLGLSMWLHKFANMDLLITNTSFGMVFFLGTLAISQNRKASWADTVVFWMVAITCALFFIRPSVSFMVEGNLTQEAYRQSTYYSVVNAVAAINSLALAGALIAATISDRFERLRLQAAADGLSGVLSRRAFENEASAMFERANAQGISLAMVVGDLDLFKRVNDIWGHQVGDRAIAEFGSLITRAIRDYDLAGRIGGEEFCILVWNADENVAASLGERLRIGISQIEIEGMGPDLHLTASFGTASRLPNEGYQALFSRADAALYAAKKAGRDQVVRADGKKVQPDRRRSSQPTQIVIDTALAAGRQEAARTA